MSDKHLPGDDGAALSTGEAQVERTGEISRALRDLAGQVKPFNDDLAEAIREQADQVDMLDGLVVEAPAGAPPPQEDAQQLARKIAWVEGSIAALQVIVRWLDAKGHHDLAEGIRRDEFQSVGAAVPRSPEPPALIEQGAEPPPRCFFMHFIGLDGPTGTGDVYGRPAGWCWWCWLTYQRDEALRGVK